MDFERGWILIVYRFQSTESLWSDNRISMIKSFDSLTANESPGLGFEDFRRCFC